MEGKWHLIANQLHLHLAHQSAATARSRQALTLDKAWDLCLRKLLAAELIGREQQDLELITKSLMPSRESGVHSSRCASSGRDVDDQYRFAREGTQRKHVAIDRLATQ